MSRPVFISLLILMLVNLWLGMEAQDLAHFFEDLFGVLDRPGMYLTIITAISLAIYVFVLGFMIIQKIRGQLRASNHVYIIILLLAIGLVVNLWSIMVLAMWWG